MRGICYVQSSIMFPVITQSTTCTTSVCTMQLRCKQVALGGIHADAHQIATRQVKMQGAALARHTGQEEGEKVGHLIKRVSILLQRGLSGMLLNRIPGHPPAEIDGQE